MKIQTAFVLLAAVTAATAGCSNASDSSGPPTGATRASLHRAKGCGDLLVDLKSDAAFKLNQSIDRQVAAIQSCIARTQDDASCASSGYAYPGGIARGDAAVGAPTAEGGAANAPKDYAASHSETNNQVAGVDEADFVKTDGKNLYVIHGRSFKVVKAWPASELAELSSIDIEGQPSEMFVEDGKVVVYSQVNGASVYAAAGVTPKNQYYDYGYGGGMPVAATDSGSTDQGGTYAPLTKITVLTLDGATATVAREMYFEGSYLDSRRVGTHVRTVLNGYAHGPTLKYGVYQLYPAPTPADPTTGAPRGAPDATPYPATGTAMIAALEQLRADNRAVLDASVLGDWIPYTFTKIGAVVQASSVACEDFYVPSTGSTESGITEVASIDLANPGAAPPQTAILGRADTVYASADTLYLAAHAWVEPPYAWANASSTSSSGSGETNGGTVASPPPSAPDAPAPKPGSARAQTAPALITSGITASSQTKTHLHKFELTTDASFPNYVASGTVVGSIKDQFSMDDRAGYLRIATTENRDYVDANNQYVEAAEDRPSTVNHVFVLGATGPWLDTVGDAGELGQNERIQSVRFVGGRGYVVTFRQVDPLFVIDLTNPTAPSKLAELTIPGFSEYMHPLDDTHLLTIGRDATSSGQVQGLKLQIFDVTNGASPALTQTFTYSDSEYGMSDAEYDHKAFTYFADQHMLAFPYYAYAQNGGMHSSLELFKVDTAAGFTKLGSIDNTPLVSQEPTGYCGGYYGPSVRRGVFLENFVYAISYGGVIAKDATNLAGAGTKLPFAAPQTNDGYGVMCGGDVAESTKE